MKDERRGTEYICLPQNTRFLSNKRQKIPRNSTKSWNIFINCLGFRGFQFKEIWYVFLRWLWLYFDLCTVNMFDSNKVYIFQSSHVNCKVISILSFCSDTDLSQLNIMILTKCWYVCPSWYILFFKYYCRFYLKNKMSVRTLVTSL